MVRFAFPAAWLTFVIVLTPLGGCNASPDAALKNDPKLKQIASDTEPLSEVLKSIPEKTTSDDSFKDLFVSGAAAASERKKFLNLTFSVDGVPRIDGTNGEVFVSITDGAGAEQSSLKWRFRKEGDAWKIVEAPLAPPPETVNRERERD
jgi:hypothetical protein